MRKRGRPRKLKLIEARRRLQQLWFSKDISCSGEIITILSTINNFNELDKAECESSKLGNLLKIVYCSIENKIWHSNFEILELVQHVAVKIKNSK